LLASEPPPRDRTYAEPKVGAAGCVRPFSNRVNGLVRQPPNRSRTCAEWALRITSKHCAREQNAPRVGGRVRLRTLCSHSRYSTADGQRTKLAETWCEQREHPVRWSGLL